jgi:hypothetical protein
MNRRPVVWIAALALSGVFAGHAVAYYLAVPGAGQRNALLAQSGHSYWSIAVTVTVLAELAGVLAVATRHFRAGRAGTSSLRMSFPQLARRMAAMQVGAFGVLEVAERARSGVPIGEMFHNHLFPIGVVIQLLVACAGALLLSCLARAAEAIGSLFCGEPAAGQATSGVRLPPRPDTPGCSPLCAALRGRAPPVLLVSLR